MNDKLTQAAMFRTELMNVLDKLNKTKNMSPNQIIDIEKDLVKDMKKTLKQAKEVFGVKENI